MSTVREKKKFKNVLLVWDFYSNILWGYGEVLDQPGIAFPNADGMAVQYRNYPMYMLY